MNKAKLLHELKSFIITFSTTFGSVLIVDGAFELINIYNGDLSNTAWIALGMALLRSGIKAMLQILLPKLFPGYKLIK